MDNSTYVLIKKTWLAPSFQAPAVALVALMRWPWMAECPCSHGRREGTFQKVYNIQLYFLTSTEKTLALGEKTLALGEKK